MPGGVCPTNPSTAALLNLQPKHSMRPSHTWTTVFGNADSCRRAAAAVFESNNKMPGIENAMWIIIRTLKGKNCFLTGSRQWSKDRNDAERFDEFHYPQLPRYGNCSE